MVTHEVVGRASEALRCGHDRSGRSKHGCGVERAAAVSGHCQLRGRGSCRGLWLWLWLRLLGRLLRLRALRWLQSPGGLYLLRLLRLNDRLLLLDPLRVRLLIHRLLLIYRLLRLLLIRERLLRLLLIDGLLEPARQLLWLLSNRLLHDRQWLDADGLHRLKEDRLLL